MAKRGVKSSDPTRSPWWLALPIGGAAVGAAAPIAAGADGIVAIGWTILGCVTGVALSATPPVKEWFTRRAGDHRVAGLAGAGDGSITGRSLDSLRVHVSDRDVSEFAPRDRLPEVRDLLANQIPVLVEGPSMSGKTRLVVQALLEGWADANLWFPTDDDGISKLVGSGQDPTAGTVVFLDDVDRFLSNSSLTVTLLDRWLAAKCVVVATMTSAKYVQWRDDASSKLPGWDVLNKLKRVHLSPQPTAGELAAMRSSGYSDLIPAARELGLPAILGGAPRAREKFRDGSEDRSWGWSLVRAAADWRRVGLGPATSEQLQRLAMAYPDAPVMAQNWEAAWDWAAKPFNATVALLRPVGHDQWEVLDLIADDARWPLHQTVLRAMAAADLSPAQSLVLATQAYAAAGHKLNDWIETLLDQAHTGNDPSVAGRAALALGAILVDEDRDSERAAILLREAMDYWPTDPVVLGVYAGWLEKSKDHDQAEQMYQRALAADPTDANILGSYAIFLTKVRGDHDQAEQMYQRALAADPTDANILGNYAILLTDIRGDHDQAEQMYQRALAADPTHANILGNYAIFLTDIRGDHDQAEQMYQRALAADPTHANNLGNYARLLFILGQDSEGERLTLQALDLATSAAELPLRAECYFYLFMHVPSRQQAAGGQLRALLRRGVSTGEWSFAENLARLVRGDDPRADFLTAVAAALESGDDTRLRHFPEWQSLPDP